MFPYPYEFKHNGFTYVLTDAGHTTEGRYIQYTKWNDKGQAVDCDVIQANTFSEAKYKLITR